MTRSERRKGVDASPDLDEHRGDEVVDPTGHVSSGLQTRPMRGVDEEEQE